MPQNSRASFLRDSADARPSRAPSSLLQTRKRALLGPTVCATWHVLYSRCRTPCGLHAYLDNSSVLHITPPTSNPKIAADFTTLPSNTVSEAATTRKWVPGYCLRAAANSASYCFHVCITFPNPRKKDLAGWCRCWLFLATTFVSLHDRDEQNFGLHENSRFAPRALPLVLYYPIYIFFSLRFFSIRTLFFLLDMYLTNNFE